MNSSPLFKPLRLGSITLPNRIIMAPLTRMRAGVGNAPTALNAEYYAQRASAGLIIAEGTAVSQQGQGYPNAPGIYTADGFVSAQLMRANRESSTTDPWEPGASSDAVDLTKDYIAYCGRYEVDGENSEVIRLPIVALLPNLIHQEQHRRFTFDGDTLTLVTTRKRPNGSVVASTLQWRRCPLEMI